MPNQLAEKVGKHLRHLRKTVRQMTLDEVQAKTGISTTTLFRIEGGSRLPTPVELKQLARALQVEVADLFTMAGYTETQELPSLPVYLRTRYDMEPAEAEQVENFVKELKRKHERG